MLEDNTTVLIEYATDVVKLAQQITGNTTSEDQGTFSLEQIGAAVL